TCAAASRRARRPARPGPSSGRRRTVPEAGSGRGAKRWIGAFAKQPIPVRNSSGDAVYIQAIRDAARKAPFEPFILRMNDGREFYIPHRDFILITDRIVAVTDPETQSIILLEPILIASLEPRPRPPQVQTATGGNNP